MSFLYKALIKEQQNTANERSEANRAANHFQAIQPAFASNQSSPNVLWITIGVLLLVVGLLAGYIFANYVPFKHTNTGSPNSNLSSPSNVEITEQRSNNISPTSTQQSTSPETEQVLVANPASSLPAINHQSNNINSDSSQQPTTPTNVETDINVNELSQSEMTVQNNKSSASSTNIEDNASVNEDMSEIPEELKTIFANAVAATEQSTSNSGNTGVETSSSLPSIEELDLIYQQQIPSLYYQMHIFASVPKERWLKVNGVTLYENEALTEQLRLEEIRQNESIWSVQGKRFTLSALTDYSTNTQ